MSGFRSFLETANGKAVSPIGTFGTSRRKNDLRLTCGSDTLYYPSDGVDAVTKSSKGVWRTEPRFKPLTDDASPGPIYKIPDDLTKQRGLAWGPPPPKPKPQQRRARDQSPPPTTSVLLPNLSQKAGKDGEKEKGEKKPRCTFGTPHRSALRDSDRASRSGSALGTNASGAADSSMVFVPPSIQTHIPTYQGRWGSPPKRPVVDEEEERRRKAKDRELLAILKQGFVQQQLYRSSTPAFSMGSRAALAPPRSSTPGPNAYNISKYKRDGRPTCPTFVGKGHDLLEFQAGQDSPGPALYSQMRYPN